MLRDGQAYDDTSIQVVQTQSFAGSSEERVVIPDAHFLFTADFKRSGSDLVLIGEDGHRVLVPNYFQHEKLPDLVSPEGAILSAHVVETLAGSAAPGQYAQATVPAGAQAIGRVDVVTGSATVQHANGVVTDVHVGDVIFKGDVIQTADGSAVNLSFSDGTALTLSAATRMSMDDFVYDPNSTANSGLLSLVQGSFAFVAGQVAHTGGLNIDTPVATMGIRGTVGGAACSAASTCEFYASPNTDGSPSTYTLIAKGSGLVIGTVSINATASVTATGVNQPPQITFQPANPGDPVNQIIQDLKTFYPQVLQNLFTPQGPQQQGPQQGPNGGSGTPPTILDNNNGIPPLTGDPHPEHTIVVEIIPPFTPPPPPPSPPEDNKSNAAALTPPIITFTNRDDTQASTPTLTTYQPADPVLPGSNIAITKVEAPATTPPNILGNLANLLMIDQATGTISYDRASFAFLSQDQQVIFTITVTEQTGGTTTVTPTTLTVHGTNDNPVIVVNNGDTTSALLSADASLIVGQLSFKDPDFGDVHSATVSSSSANLITIDPDAPIFIPHFSAFSETSSVVITVVTLPTFLIGTPFANVRTGTDTTGADTTDPNTHGVIDWGLALTSADAAAVRALARGESVVETFTVTVSDGHGGFANQDVSVTLVGVNDAPILTPEQPVFAAIPVGQTTSSAQTVDQLLADSVNDPDHFAVQGIAITAVNDGGLGHWEYALNGSDWTPIGAVSDASALLLASADQIRFVSDNGAPETATFTYRAWDQTSGNAGDKADASVTGGETAFSTQTDTASVEVVGENHAPTLDNVTSELTYTENDPALPLSPVLTVGDADNGPIASATVHISGGALAGDLLTANTSGTGITASYDAVTETLTLTGSDTLADYQQVLRTVAFQSSSDNPTNFGADTTRTIDWQLNDGAAANNLSAIESTTVAITAVNDAPVVNGGTIRVAVVYASFQSGPTALAAQLNDDTFFNFDAHVVQIGQADTMAELDQYDIVIPALSYQEAGSEDFYAALRDWVLADHGGVITTDWFAYKMNGNTLTPTEIANADAVTPIAANSLGWAYSPASVFTIDSNNPITQGITSLPGGLQWSATALLDPAAVSLASFSGASNSFTNASWSGIAYEDQPGIGKQVWIGGFYSDESYQQAAIRSGVGDQLLEQAVHWAANGGTGGGGTISYAAAGPAVAISPQLTVSDVDSLTLAAAVVSISAGFLAGDLLTIDTSGTSLAAGYNAATGVLTLTGIATPADYQQVLRTVSFSSTSDDPSANGTDLTRTISWQVNDGSAVNGLSATENTILSIAATDHAPTAVGFANAVSAIPENTDTSAGVKVADILITDDGVGSNVLTLTGADAGSFAIVGNALYLKAGLLDFESGKTSYSVQVAADDGAAVDTNPAGPDALSAVFTINVTDVNEFSVSAPVDADAAAANAVAENTAVGTYVGIAAFASDADGTTNAVTYSLSSNPGGLFAIDPNTGVVTTAAAIDRETLGPSVAIEVTATSADGSHAAQTFAIAINDVNEFSVSTPIDTNAAANAVDEGAATGTVVGVTAHATDADATTNAVSYALTDNANGAFQIDNASGVITVLDGSQIVFASLASLDVTVRATSADGSLADSTFAIGVNKVNAGGATTPVDSDAADNAVNENAAVGTPVGLTAHATDPDVTDTISYALTGNPGGLFAIDVNTGVVTTAAAIDREAAGPSVNIEVTATSSDGSHAAQTFAIGINDVNEFSVSTPVDGDTATSNAVTENTPIGTYTGLTAFAADADATINTVFYSLTSNPGGLFAIVANTGAVITAAAIDREAVGPTVDIEVTATSVDGSHAAQTFTIAVNDVNEFGVSTPIDTDAAANVVDENVVPGTVVGITAFAADADATNNAVFYTLSNSAGGLFAIDPNTGVVTTAGPIDRETLGPSVNIEVTALSADGSLAAQTFAIAINDVNEFSVSAPIDTDAAANAVNENVAIGTVVGMTAFASDADATNNAVTYALTGNPGGLFAIDPNTGVVTTAAAIDREAVGPSANIEVTATSADGSHAAQTFAIAINDVNEFSVSTPVDTNAAANAVNENVAIGTLVGVTASASDADATNNTVTYSLTGNPGGLFAIDANTGVVTTAAAIDREAVGASVAIEVTATSSDGSHAAQTFAIAINDVNEFSVTAPVDTNAAANAVDEGAATGTIVGVTAHATDADATTNTVSYSLTDNANGAFQIDSASGVITVLDGSQIVFADTASLNVTVRAASADGSVADSTFAVAVNKVNAGGATTPVDNDDATNAVDENAAVGTQVGLTAHSTDPDAADTITYSLTNNPGGLFAIDANTGVVTTAAAIDRETVGPSINIEVTATSSDGSHAAQTFAIAINDVNEFSVSALTDSNPAANAVSENVAVGTVVGVTGFASDADATNNTVTYSLTGNPGGLFAIDANTGVVTTASTIDREAVGPSVNIEVTATSSDGSHAAQTFAIAINDVNEFSVSTPTDSNPAANAVNENVAVGTVVGVTAFASDADATNNTVTYALTGNPGGLFAIDANTGVVTTAAAVDREVIGPNVNIEVTATSADGSHAAQTFTIAINDVNEFSVSAPVDANSSQNAVNENSPIGTHVGVTAFATDADATSNTVTYSLTGNPGGLFAIDANTGVVTTASTIDREAVGPSVNIEVTATSSDGSHAAQVFAIAINDVNEFTVSTPTDSNPAANAVNENVAVGTVVGVTAFASDADATNNTVTYSLSSNPGGLFAIDPNTGAVTTAAAIDRETVGPSANIEVTATSADGSHAAQTFAIAINDVNEFTVSTPTDTNPAANAVDENVAAGTVVGVTAFASDADATNNTVTYALTGNPGGLFAIDANTGVVTTAAAVDREVIGPNVNIEVTATSTDGSHAAQTFAIAINDVNEFSVSTPTDTDAAANAVDEGAATGTLVGVTAQATDADATTNTVSYSLTENANGAFQIDSVSGVVSVLDGSQIVFATHTSLDITVRATSADGSQADSLFTINVNKVNHAPVAVDDTNSVQDEINPVATGNVLSNDSDPDNDTLTVTNVVHDAAGPGFIIADGTYGQLTIIKATGDYVYVLGATQAEAAAVQALAQNEVQSDKFTYTIDDGHGLTASADLTISVTGVDDAPVLGGDRAINMLRGGATQLTTADLTATDADTPDSTLQYQVMAGSEAHGHVAVKDSNGALIQSATFTQTDLAAGNVYFVHNGDDPGLQSQFSVSLTDNAGAPPQYATVFGSVTTVRIDVLSPDGVNFDTEDPLAEMGQGKLQSGIQPGFSQTHFTIVYDAPGNDPAAGRRFDFDGNFTYDASGNPSGFISAIHAFTNEATPAPLFDFTAGPNIVLAQDWLAAAVAKAEGDSAPFHTLTSSWSFAFNGNLGDDAFGSDQQQDYFVAATTAGFGGNDTFDGGSDFDRVSYIHAPGPIDVQLADGTVAGNGLIGTDTLRSIEFVSGTDFADTFNAGATALNPGGFSSQSTNAGSIGGFNVAGTFNQFEGRGDNDLIIGNGDTRASYLHALAGVIVDLSLGTAQSILPNDAAGVGIDTLINVNRVLGSAYDDILIGSDNAANTTEIFEGRGGNDTIIGNGGFDNASYGNEPTGGIVAHLAAGVVVGDVNTGTDALQSVEGITGTEFNDIYDAAADSFSGVAFGAAGAANVGSFGTFNQFEGRGGDDTIVGNGNTRIAYQNAAAGVLISFAAETLAVADPLLGPVGTVVGHASSILPNDAADVGLDRFVGVNAARGSEFGDIITGNGGNNSLDGRGGDDVLSGLSGNDTLTGGTGADIFVYTNAGQAGGADVVTDFKESEGDRIDLRTLTVGGFSGLTIAQVSNDTVLTFGGTGNTLTLQGITSTDLKGRDFLFHGMVAITVQSPDGFDFSKLYDDLAGAEPNQSGNNGTHFTAVNATAGLTFSVSGANFTFDVSGHPSGGTVSAVDIYDSASDMLVSSTGWSFDAGQLSQAISDYAGPAHSAAGLDSIFITNLNTDANPRYSAVGSFGADTFLSSAGNDSFIGLANSDVNSPGDTVDYSRASNGVTVSLAISGQQNTIGAGQDTLVNIENLRGSAFSDTLTGDGNANILAGGPGNDTLTGLGGNDTFVFKLGDGHDTLTDFVSGQDKVDLTVGLSQAQVDAVIAAATPGTHDLDFGNGNIITFNNVDVHQLHAGIDFIVR